MTQPKQTVIQSSTQQHCVLGIDAGGTATRWALVMPNGEVIAEGVEAPLTGLVCSHEEREATAKVLRSLSHVVSYHAQPDRIVMGLTGFSYTADLFAWFAEHLLTSLTTPKQYVTIGGDIPFAFLSCLAAGEGYFVYAGTGSVAAFIDEQHQYHRVGGRGGLLDDAGAGYWMAAQALQYIWRNEDTKPNSWHESPLAKRLFNTIGGADWPKSREYIYQSGRGKIGMLAMDIAASVDDDALAVDILQRAGHELARLANVCISRFGARPIILSGGAAHLHPLILESMRARLMAAVPLKLHRLQAASDCARLVAQPDSHTFSLLKNLAEREYYDRNLSQTSY